MFEYYTDLGFYDNLCYCVPSLLRKYVFTSDFTSEKQGTFILSGALLLETIRLSSNEQLLHQQNELRQGAQKENLLVWYMFHTFLYLINNTIKTASSSV